MPIGHRVIMMRANLLFLLVLAVPMAAQSGPEKVAPLPFPPGSCRVGTTVAYFADSTRPQKELPVARPITVQLWYPASSTAAPAPYLWEAPLGSALMATGYYGVDSVTIHAWSLLQTHSSKDAAPAPGKHPLLAFSVGLGVARANYTSIAETLASYGYIVALVESPLQGFMVTASGMIVTDTAGIYGAPAIHREGVADWARDISFTIGRLGGRHLPGPTARVAAAIDFSRIGALGHSSGGLVAVATCETDGRVHACANMDGGLTAPDGAPLADFVPRGIHHPTLFLRSQPLYDDSTLARRGMTREQWTKRGAAGKLAFDSLAARSKGQLWSVQVAGTGHFSFSDAPFVMPSAITRFGGRIIAPERGWQVITAVLRAWFDRELRQRGEGITPLTVTMPELTVAPPP